ncbi:hypothetical protein DFH08DRAFT_895916 [Mycena albidolilacea]|uniref:MARVEL domain-containing protein n=1 Tax=Mycena albidolilacea TaxID=1033008 RepID=A0AAD7EDG5_9AGAR|nr:hypothetical protein DFH08DRAFT_895916 [Mycena albidolilacea]
MALPLSLIRLVVLGTVLLFSLIALGLAGDLTTTSMRAFGVYFSFAALAIATAVLCFLTLPAMIALEIMRPGGPTSMIIVELSWLGFLSILWLATGANAAEFVSVGFWFDCNDTGRGENPANATGCHEMSAVAAFGFLNWLILMGYTGLLTVLSLIAANRKHTGVWTSSVANAPFDQPAHTPSAPGGSYGGETTQVGGTGGVGGHPAAYENTSGSVQAGTVHV